MDERYQGIIYKDRVQTVKTVDDAEGLPEEDVAQYVVHIHIIADVRLRIHVVGGLIPV